MRSHLCITRPFLVGFAGVHIILAVARATTASAQSQPVEGTWHIVPSPNGGPQPQGNTLLDVVALSPTDAWAVGFHHSATYCTTCPEPLAMHWDGAKWSLVNTPTIAVPKVKLESVSAVSSDDVWAVGHSHNPDCGLCGDTLIEHWDGKSWSVVPSPNPGLANALYGVSARAANDIWAVGDQWLNFSTKIPLILHYDGSTWSVVSYPPVSYGELTSVFALAEDDVWAVGISGVLSTGFQTLTLHWDGTSWTQVPFPAEPGALYVALYNVSGVASDDVWAVGVHKYLNGNGHQISLARAYHWDGSSWTSVLPGVYGPDSRMYDVHAIASNNAWAVGGEPCPQFNPPCSDPNMAFRYVTVHWDGKNWSNVETPNQGVLLAVAAVGGSSDDAWAVGWGMDSLAYSTGTHTLRYQVCPGDVTGDCGVNINDLLAVINNWGPCSAPPANCPADIAPQPNGDGVVNVNDLLMVINNWG